MRGWLLAFLAATAPVPVVARDAPEPAPWATATSDIPVDPQFRFGQLDNGLRYIVRHNATPTGTAVVRMDVAAGSLDEADTEQGYAHFVEHMAFNGSARVPEGEMVRLLEREGLAFGADTNASTSFDRTLYKLDLPRNDPVLLDTALMLMRETASALTLAPQAVDRERGVVLAEMRERNTWSYRNALDSTRFFYAGSRYAERFPIGTVQSLRDADAASLKDFYEREYVPGHVVLVIVGDFDPAVMEAAIVRHFGDWAARPAEPQPAAGPVSRADPRAEVYLDPALSERIVIQRNGPWLEEPDSVAQREEAVLRAVGYAALNRRLRRFSRSAEPPFRGAGFGTGDVFEAGRSTRLIVDAIDGKWRIAMQVAAHEYRRALARGFSADEVAEQVTQYRTALANAAASAATRSNAELAQAALALVQDRIVPSTPQSALERFENLAPRITPARVLAALKREALPLDRPLIRFQGRKAPEGDAPALLAAWKDAMHSKLPRSEAVQSAGFAYESFGEPGQVVADTRDERLGIRELRFANGVMLNIRRTDLEKDRVLVRASIDGGFMLNTRENPLATEMANYLDEGGLARHSRDALDSILAGHKLSLNFRPAADSFVSTAQTTPEDLGLQLDLFAALVTDPGYRPEGQVQYLQQVNNAFARMRATPGSALGERIGGILSDDDPRFTVQRQQDYRHLTYDKLRADIGERLRNGAIEIGVVGDVDEERVIAQVARSFGALPEREPAFRPPSQDPRTFTQDRSPRVIHHTGPADQALIRVTWPTRDNRDPEETIRLSLLERIMRVELTDQLREDLGKAYAPSAESAPSEFWPGYGTFSVMAAVDVGQTDATRAAIRTVVEELRCAPVDADILLRARQPMVESLQNALKTNAGWLGLAARAQSRPEQLDRFLAARERLMALTAADVQETAQRYLAPAAGLAVVVLPEGPAVAAQSDSSVGTSSSK